MTIVRFQPVHFKPEIKRQPTPTIKPAQNRQPAVNISEDDKAVYIALATPGMNRSDFEISLETNRLLVKGKAADEEKTQQSGFVNRAFEKSFIISDRVDTERITAKSQDGILTITLPKNDKVLTVKVN